MNGTRLLLVILGMSLVTYLPRVLPFLLLRKSQLHPWFLAFLSYIPISILSALLIPDLILSHGHLAISMDNQKLLAALPTVVVAYLTRSLYLTVVVGLGTMAFLRVFCP